jgi:hypothetical protein
MTTNRSLATPAARLCRPSRLHCRSGASSLLRLST